MQRSGVGPQFDGATKAAYEAAAQAWTDGTEAWRVDDARALRERAKGLILDIGCGPGWHLPVLEPSIGVDLAHAMLQIAQREGPVAQADLFALPVATAAIGGVWASRSLVHLPRTEVPLALAELHRVLAPDGLAWLWLFEGDHELRNNLPTNRLRGRLFSYWPRDLLQRTLVGAGFAIDGFETWESGAGEGQIIATVRRMWTLPDFVGPDMKVLVCGLNPSPGSADGGVGFHRPGNRFWPAAMQAGLVTRDRDPRHALAEHGVGMTDLVKRTTRRADELSADEYRDGLERVRQVVEWLQPEAVCMVGLSGWRAAVNRKAARGWQPETLADRPVYLMPSTSGLNAHDTVDSLAAHLAAAAAGR